MNMIQLCKIDPLKDTMEQSSWALKPGALDQLVLYLQRLELEGVAMKMNEETTHGGTNGKKD